MVIVYIVKFISKKNDSTQKNSTHPKEKSKGEFSQTIRDVLEKFDIDIPESIDKPNPKPKYVSDPYKDLDDAKEQEWEHKYHEEKENNEFEVDILGKRVKKKKYFSYDNEVINYNEAVDSRSKIHKHNHSEDLNYHKVIGKSLFDEESIENYDWQKAMAINEVLNVKKWED